MARAFEEMYWKMKEFEQTFQLTTFQHSTLLYDIFTHSRGILNKFSHSVNNMLSFKNLKHFLENIDLDINNV